MRLPLASLALLALVVEMCLLGGRLEWFDAYLNTALRGLGTGHLARSVMNFTKAAPFIGAALVIGGVAIALRAGTDAAKVRGIIVQLVAGLLLAWAFKLFFERARPGDLPWDLAGDSFPSGHVANALLCVGTSLRLVRRGRNEGGGPGLSRLVLVAGGLMFVPAVAFTRIVLERHWMTDVLGSLLLGSALLALAPVPRPATTRRLLLAMPLVLLGAWVASATGSRIRLPSPSTLSGGADSRRQANDDYLGAMEIDHASLASGRTPDRLALLTPSYGKQQVDVHDGRSAILKLLARPHFDITNLAVHRLELLVDGAIVGTQPLGSGWRMLAFALPTLAPGVHEFELRPHVPGSAAPRQALSAVAPAIVSPPLQDASPR